MLGTEVTIKIFSHSHKNSSLIFKKTFDEIKRVEDLASFFDKSSELFLLNSKAAYAPVKASDELFYLIEMGLWMSGQTEGVFDITATSLGRKDGYKEVITDKERKEIYFKDKNCRLDLGAYAKGYAVDRAVSVLRTEGIKNALVDAGGDIRFIGRPSPDKKWKIGVRNPLYPQRVFKVLDAPETDLSLATSGNYLRKHIVALRERDEAVLSVTVIAPTVLEADLFSTAVFNMGYEQRLKVLEKFNNIEVLLVVKKENGRLKLIKEKSETQIKNIEP